MNARKAKQLRRLRDQARLDGHAPPGKARRLVAWLAWQQWRTRVAVGRVRLASIRTGPPVGWRGALGQAYRRPAGYAAGPSEQAAKRAARRERERAREAEAA